MECKPPRPMTPFDDMVTPPQLYTLKLLLPYTPSSNQRFLAVYIKFMEFQYAMQNFRGFPTASKGSSPFYMIQELMPFMGQEEKGMMEQMEMMMNMMEMFQGSQGSEGGGGSGGFNPMDMMMNMLDPEQQEMFQMYNNMFDSDMKDTYTDNDKENKEEGDESYE